MKHNTGLKWVDLLIQYNNIFNKLCLWNHSTYLRGETYLMLAGAYFNVNIQRYRNYSEIQYWYKKMKLDK